MSSVSDLRFTTEAPYRGLAWLCLAPVLSLLATATAANTSEVLQCLEADRKKPDATIVITDLEPDDRFALHVLAHNLDPADIALAGTTLLYTSLKTALLRRLLDQLDLGRVKVVQGFDRTADEYPPTRSSDAARSFAVEGVGILSSSELSDISKDRNDSTALQLAIIDVLSKHARVDIVLLAPGDDLAAALKERPALADRIACLFMMGGWQNRPEKGLRSTYNWNMAPEAADYLLSRDDLPIVLFSSHALRKSFASISANRGNFPELWQVIEDNAGESQSISETLLASATWDKHIVSAYPAVREVLEPHVGRNFSPADPTVAIAAIDPGIIEGFQLMTVKLDVDNLDEESGFLVNIKRSDSGHIASVDSVNLEIFRQRMSEALRTTR
jgi:inosine-uridine nucleoside N-ribohydrolase